MSSVEMAIVYGFSEVSDQVLEEVLKWLSPVEQLASTRVCKRFVDAAFKHVKHLDLKPIPPAKMLDFMMKIPFLTSIEFNQYEAMSRHPNVGPNDLNPVMVALAAVNPNLKRINTDIPSLAYNYLMTVMSRDDKYNGSKFKSILDRSTAEALAGRHPGHKIRYRAGRYSDGPQNGLIPEGGVLFEYSIGYNIDDFDDISKHVNAVLYAGHVGVINRYMANLNGSKQTIEILRVLELSSITGMRKVLDLLPSFPKLKDISIDLRNHSNNHETRSKLDLVLMIPTLKDVSLVIAKDDHQAICELFLNCPRNDFHSFRLKILDDVSYNYGTCRKLLSVGREFPNFAEFFQKFSPSKFRVFKFRKMSDLVEAATHCLPLVNDKPNYKFKLILQSAVRGLNRNLFVYSRDIPSFLASDLRWKY